MTNPLLSLLTPYGYATILSITMAAVATLALRRVRKRSYGKRTIILGTPLLITVATMVLVSSMCFTHWLNLQHSSSCHGLCIGISPQSINFVCTLFVALGFSPYGSALALGIINYRFGERIAVAHFNAKPLFEKDAGKIADTLKELSRRATIPTPRLYLIESSTPKIFTVATRKNSAIMVSVGLLETLTPDELEASLAHEIAHIKNNDGLIKSLMSTLKYAVPFIIPSYLLEPAICREREFLADEAGANLSRKPFALISALMKMASAQSFSQKTAGGFFSKFSIGFSLESPVRGGFFEKHPPLKERLDRLLALAERREFSNVGTY